MSKIKIFDYQAIFLTLRNADKTEINPRFIGTTFKLPVLKYLKDPQKKFNGMFWDFWIDHVHNQEFQCISICLYFFFNLIKCICARICAHVSADIFIFYTSARICAQLRAHARINMRVCAHVYIHDAKKKGGTRFVQKKKSDESGSGQFYFYLKGLSKEGVCQIWQELLVVPTVGDHNWYQIWQIPSFDTLFR